MDVAFESDLPLPLANGIWLLKEHSDLQRQTHIDIATSLGDKTTNLVEVVCSARSVMRQTVQAAGLVAERWTTNSVDLLTTVGTVRLLNDYKRCGREGSGSLQDLLC